MSSREQLIENYEDALFALMMDDIAQSEGERLLRENAVLKNEAGASVPPGLHKRCLQTIRSALLRQKSGASVRFAGRLLVRLAAAVFVTAALFSAAFAASPSFRATTLNLLMSMNDELVEWTFKDKDENTDVFSVDPSCLPDGYEMIEETRDPFCSSQTYQNKSGHCIYITLLYGNQDAAMNTDKEDVIRWEEITIHGLSVVAVEKWDVSSVSWFWQKFSVFIDIQAEDLTLEQLESIAEEIISRS